MAALLWVSREVGAGVLGAAFWAPLPVCLRPTSRLSYSSPRAEDLRSSSACLASFQFKASKATLHTSNSRSFVPIYSYFPPHPQ